MKSPPAENRPRTRIAARLVIGLSCLNLVVLSFVNYLLYFVSEAWWPGTVVTYAPRILFLLPTLIVLLGSLIWHRGSIGMNLISTLIAVGPVMGLSLPFDRWLNGSAPIEGESLLKVVSCNVQSYAPDFGKVLKEISKLRPDVVALQEAFGDNEQADDFFREWKSVRHGQYRVFSKYRVSLISECEVSQFGGRSAGMVVQIEAPFGPVVLGNIHQMTPRFGLEELDRQTLINGKGTKELQDFVRERHDDCKAIRMAINTAHESSPLIVCGDFNTPTCSILYQRYWGDFKNCFDSAGIGFGYTSPCKGNRYWPDNTPWARIDHILCSQDWSVRDCQIGQTDGSDHRLIAATLVLKKPSSP